MLFSGDRRYALIGMIACLLCYMRKYSLRIGIKRLLLFAGIAFFGLTLLTTIRRTRAIGSVSFEVLLSSFITSLKEDNVVYELFNEFGLTFYTYMLAIKNIPSVITYKYGVSYLYALLSIIPGAYRIFYSDLMENNVYQSIYEIEGQALGGAFGQELFGNFGFLAIPIAIVAGYLIMRSLGSDDSKYSKDQVKYYSLFYLFLNLVRASFSEIIRVLIYYYVLIWFLKQIVFMMARKKRV